MNDELVQRARTLRAKAESMLEHGASDEEAQQVYREAQVLSAAAKAESLPRRSDWQELEEHRSRMKAAGMAYPDDDGADTGDSGVPVGDDLYGAIMKAGFDRKTHSTVTVSAADSVGLRFKDGSYGGNFASDPGVLDLEASPALGADERFLYPRLRAVGIGSDITSVQSYRQASRTLAAAASMVRAIDATSTKPSTDTASELKAEYVKQIASISSAIPNVLLENTGFRQWVQTDLTLAYRRALDYMITTAITTAVTTVTGSASGNAYEDVLQAQLAVRAQGYNPSLVVLSPGDALDLQLLTLGAGEVYAFSQARPAIVITPAVADSAGFVLDPAAAGTLFLSPAVFAVFEENAGASNTSTARFEGHGVFSVQRPAAVCLISGGS